jgi:RND family efflux transporter MFP subunit
MNKFLNIAAALALACTISSVAAQDLASIAMTAKQQQVSGITVAAINLSSNTESRLIPGEIVVPVGQQRVVGAAQSGLIDALYVAAGEQVKKGQPLGHISSPDLLGLQRDYLQALTQNRLAKNTYDRDAELFKDGIIAERRYLTSKSAFEEVNALLNQRAQALKLSGMPDVAISRLGKTSELTNGLTITSPIDGQVLEQLATTGQRIDAMMPIFHIGSLTPLWLEMHAPVESFKSLAIGMKVSIPQYQAEGKIIAIIRNINKNDQTMTVRAEINQHAERLSPGQFVEASVANDSVNAKQFSLPRVAVVRQGADSYIFVQTDQGFTPLKVQVLSEQANQVVIAGALSGTEKVAVSGTSAIKAAWLGAGGE